MANAKVRKIRVDNNIAWILSSTDPTPLAFFRLIQPTHRSRALEKYVTALDLALERSKACEEVQKKLLNMKGMFDVSN